MFVCICLHVVCLVGCLQLHLCVCICRCTCMYGRLWVVGSCSLYFHESCSIQQEHSPRAPCYSPVQPTVMAACCRTPHWLYIIPTFLLLGFLFVFPDGLSRLSLGDYKETILRVERRWTHD